MLTLSWMEVIQSRVALTRWERTPAFVEKAELLSSRGSKGGSTWRATGTFHYEFRGEKYTSSQLNFSSGSDNVGSYQQDLVQRLQDAMARQAPLTCYVNPEHPTEAVLDPDWRPEMFLFLGLAGGAFGGVGLGFGVFSLLGFKQAIAARLNSGNHPRWDERDSNVLKPDFTGGSIGSVITLLVVHAATLPLWTRLGNPGSAGTGARVFIAIALLGAVVTTILCLLKLVQFARYRSARLELDRIPAILGQPFRCRLALPGGGANGRPVEIAFRCVERITEGSGKRARTRDSERWSKNHTVPPPSDARLPIPFSCDLPAEQLESTLPSQAGGIRWWFEAKSGPPLLGMRLRFEVPVARAG